MKQINKNKQKKMNRMCIREKFVNDIKNYINNRKTLITLKEKSPGKIMPFYHHCYLYINRFESCI